MISFLADEPQKKPGVVMPDYTQVGDHIGAYMAVLFGKRFDNMGILESHGRFAIPEIGVYNVPHRLNIPHNSDHVRADIPVPLNLSEVKRLHTLLHGQHKDVALLVKFNAACAFYYLAIGNFEANPEVSYLHLITAGEILAGAVDLTDDQLLDEQLKKALEQVTEAMGDEGAMARYFRGRLRQVKRRFKLALGGLLDPGFFERSESTVEYGRLNEATIDKRLGAAYDLRSRYVHTGVSFGQWISRSSENSEVPFGTPVLSDVEFVKILSLAPNFLGLERIIRYCLLRFGERHFGLDLAISAP
ncbi:hypothetical protein [Devosia sp. UYZn731]|uniref:hypothetical protein n=1 Tax=Devosia sp. UYZn731 TaxID=3156345 RepID=UPI0033926202